MSDISTTDTLTNDPARARSALRYQTGLGNEFETEALPGALPIGQNSPQKPPYGLISELASGTTFTAPRALNKRSYLFRMRPSVLHGRFEQLPLGELGNLLAPPFELPAAPHDYCWGPLKSAVDTSDFIEGLATVCGNGSPLSQSGMAVHVYSATTSMEDRVFANADGEFVIVPYFGGLRLVTEFGVLEVSLGEIAVIPEGVKFRVELLDGPSYGFVAENFGRPLRLPELGLIGSNGLANTADFQIPVAAYEEKDTPVQLIHKLGGNLWSASMDHSPFDVVAWRGSLYPYKYDLYRFVAMNTATVDHPDPSIFCLLTSPSDAVLGPNLEIMALPPRWLVSEHSFRPPGFHRNAICEFVALLKGSYLGLEPGSATLTNNWTAHGPETEAVEIFREGEQPPVKVDDQLLVLFESRFPIQITHFAASVLPTIDDYRQQWNGFKKRFAK